MRTERADGSETEDVVFVFEPQLEGDVNVTRWLRAGAGVGYRLVAGLDDHSAPGFRGFTAGVHVQLGRF